MGTPCYLRNKGVLEVYGVVKGLSRREFSYLGFSKHLGILGIGGKVSAQLSLMPEQGRWRE